MLPQVKRVFIEDCGYIAVQSRYHEQLKNFLKEQLCGSWRQVFINGELQGMAWCIDPVFEPSLKKLLDYSNDEFSYDAAFLAKSGISREGLGR